MIHVRDRERYAPLDPLSIPRQAFQPIGLRHSAPSIRPCAPARMQRPTVPLMQQAARAACLAQLSSCSELAPDKLLVPQGGARLPSVLSQWVGRVQVLALGSVDAQSRGSSARVAPVARYVKTHSDGGRRLDLLPQRCPRHASCSCDGGHLLHGSGTPLLLVPAVYCHLSRVWGKRR